MAPVTEYLDRLDQVGIVVKNLEKAKEAFKKILGAEPDAEPSFHHKNSLFRGKPTQCGVRMAIYNFADIEIEVICPEDDGEESTWREFTREHGNGIHHVRFNITDHEALAGTLARNGILPCHSGDSSRGGGIKFAYYDIPSIGFTFETLNIREFEDKQNPSGPAVRLRPVSGKKTRLQDELTCLDQIAIVAPDLDKAKAEMKRIFGVKPNDDVVKYHKNAEHRGLPTNCGVRILVYNFCNVELEIMGPVNEEKNLWQDFIDQHGCGLHHIRFSVTDHDYVKDELARSGIDVYQGGDSTHGKGIKFAYYDMGEDLGFILETLNCPPEQSKHNPEL